MERRKHLRFRVKDKAYALLKGDPIRPVPIIDASPDGLGIGQLEDDFQLTDPSKLEIMLVDCSFFLENLPFTLISSLRHAHPNVDQIPPVRYHGVQFKNLMSNQKHQLKYFIRNYTTGGLTPQFLKTMNKMWHQIWANPKLEQSCYRILNSLQRPMF